MQINWFLEMSFYDIEILNVKFYRNHELENKVLPNIRVKISIL